MITILTGTPGNGKTAHAIDLCWFDKSSTWYPLNKYVDGIAQLKCEHFEFPDIKELKRADYQPLAQIDDEKYAIWLPENPQYQEFLNAKANAKTSIELWFLWATPKSVLIIDEAQRYFRPRPAGSPVPLYIQLLEYHRHFGVHFLLISQRERYIHSNVRGLAGQHIHLTDGWKGRHRFEWPEVKDSDSKSEKQLAAHSDYKLPKHVFPYYVSSVENLKVKHKTPFYFYLTVGSFLLVPVLLFLFGAHFKAKYFDSAPVPVVASGSVQSVSSFDAGSSVAITSTLEKFTPVVPGRPDTAPAYDGLRQVVAVPLVSACLQSSSRCSCYTQQGTRIADISVDACRQYLSQGVQFNPYVKDSSASANPSGSGFNGFVDGTGATIDSRLVWEPVTASDVGHMASLR